MAACFRLPVSAALLVLACCASAAAQLPAGVTLQRDAQGWVYVDARQRPLLRPFLYDNGPDYIQEGLARFVDNGKIGFHDADLNIVIPARYDFAFPFEHGEARAGFDCWYSREGEHTSVHCLRWETLRRP
ncbi:hypothetical protein BTL55_02720 [Bordetella trematum]|uniref:WG repeat-containing protein n=1 Tax=Bordetella trematum TaxID=123899 RepID=UPI000470D464|nr:WG repeat-containing protein [Bordetella trematum]AUL46013.1 hypothetical protein BTL55_02720 [Bordetella trematum]QIM71377.1 WG repeat-containing protein [Bordetella trematum]